MSEVQPQVAPQATATDGTGRTGFRQALAEWLPRQRWFGAKERPIATVAVEDSGSLTEGSAALEVAVTVVRVEHTDGSVERYHLPLATARGESAHPSDPGAVIIEDAGGTVFDALAEPHTAALLWRAIVEGGDRHLGTGRLHGAGAPGLEAMARDVSPLGKEQSNSSLIVDSRHLLKCMRRVEFVRSPELEMTAALQRGGFAHIAPVLAALQYEVPGQPPALLAMVQPYLRNGVEGWALALGSLRDLYAEAEERELDAHARLEAVAEQGGMFVPESVRLGTITAEMHVALAAGGLDPEVQSQPVTREQLDAWAGEMLAELDALLRHDDPRLDALRDGRERLRAHLTLLRELEPRGLSTRVHGDYHLGQVLRTDGGWTVLDFEGEPSRPPEQRRRLSSPLRDVAGMLRSFDYAAAAALAERTSPRDPQWDALLDQGDAWSHRQRDAFWEAYLRVCSGTPLLPPPDDALVLRRAFELQKAVYEVRYELGHRPDWVVIPLRFLMKELR